MIPNLHVCYMDESELKKIHGMDIRVNSSDVTDTKYEEPTVTYLEVIKARVYFELFKCGKELLKKQR